MFNKILGRVSGFRPQAQSSNYGRKLGGGLALPVLAYLGWRYRGQIKEALRSRFGTGAAPATDTATSTTPGYPTR